MADENYHDVCLCRHIQPPSPSYPSFASPFNIHPRPLCSPCFASFFAPSLPTSFPSISPPSAAFRAVLIEFFIIFGSGTFPYCLGSSLIVFHLPRSQAHGVLPHRPVIRVQLWSGCKDGPTRRRLSLTLLPQWLIPICRTQILEGLDLLHRM